MSEIRIVSSFTVDPVVPLLERALTEFGLNARVSLGPYGQILQSLLSPSGFLQPDSRALAFLVIRADDLMANGTADERAEELAAAVRSYRARSDQPLVVMLTEPSTTAALAWVEGVQPLLENIADVFVITPETIRRRYRCQVIHDPAADKLGHIPYTRTYFAALALSIVRFAWRFRQPERKVLVLDCDNTLWHGICGESGPHGVEIDEASRSLQSFAVRQSHEGTVVCLASKNLEDDVRDVFELNPDMVLGLGDVIASRINWEPKSANLKALAESLDLSVDSFVFIDDNPVEIAEVAAVHPGVLPIAWPAGSPEASTLVDHLWALDRLRSTRADALRVQSYRENVARSALRAESPTFADFIRSLDLAIAIGPLVAADVSRVAQLFVRTTQFNAGNGRYSEAALLGLASKPECHILTAKVSDRFGDYGLVGVVMAEDRGDELCVLEFLMSCRVLGKGVEHALLREVGHLAASRGRDRIRIVLSTTPRNLPMRRFLASLPHERAGEHFLVTQETLRNTRLPEEEAAARAPLDGVADESHEVVDVSPASVALDSREVHRRAFELADPEKLIALFDARRESRPAELQWVAPKAGSEEALAAIWAEILRIEPVGRTDPFKALGGSSLDMVRVHRLIQERLQREVPLADLLSASTIAEIAALFDRDNVHPAAMDTARERAALQRQFARNVRNLQQKQDSRRS